jgi:putative oxidoreductase
MDEAAPSQPKFANSIPDWAARVLIFAVFLFFAAGKFTSNPNAPWVVLFREVGFGQWFRYFTGILEIAGAFLVLIPRSVTAALILLMGTTSGAILVVVVVLHRPADVVVPFALLAGLIAFWLRRRRA